VSVNDAEMKALLRSRCEAVEERVQAACQRAGRARGDVTVVAVTKTVSAEVAAVLPALGLVDLGENRPQELWHKAAMLSAPVRWHLIGHLQRNKIERTVPLVHLIHSVDSVRLLNALEEEATRRQISIPVLLEVNASREVSKHGFGPEELPTLLPQLARLRRVRIEGLMTMAAFEPDPERCRATFIGLRALRDRLHGEFVAPHRIEQLSMGMTNDFEVAIEEGATLVRIGTALFGDLDQFSR
jgi:pyridoxal phosphate enzyme (YggS family)